MGQFSGASEGMRPVLASVAGGSVTGALLTLARELSLSSPSSPFYLSPPSPSEVCSVLSPPPLGWSLDWTSFGFGLAVGILFIPLLDLTILLRLAWIRALRQALAQRPAGPLHRLVA